MDYRGKVIDCTDYLQHKAKSRRRRRFTVGLIIAIIIGWWLLLLIRCESKEPDLQQKGDRRMTLAGPVPPPLRPRQSPERDIFSNQYGVMAPWATELFGVLQARKTAVKSCFPSQKTYSFTWRFSYQPKGTILHQEFIWPLGIGEGQPEACLQQVLGQPYRVKSLPQDQDHWINLEIQFSTGMEPILSP